jgi:hypothetical protein
MKFQKGEPARQRSELRYRCSSCGHYSYKHGPGEPCGGMDAAGDTCDCETTFQPVPVSLPRVEQSGVKRA